VSSVTEITNHIELNWVTVLFGLASAVLSVLYSKLNKIAKESIKRNNAVGEGVQAILRNEIIEQYYKYKDKNYCSIYAKENIKRLYKPYQNLGGNGVINKLVEELLEMPTERSEK